MTTKTTNNIARPHFDTGRWLVYGAAAFASYHMGRAFHVYDPDGWHLGNVNVGGLILGAILNVMVAQTALRLPAISATFATLKELMPRASKKADKSAEQARSRALKKLTLAMKQNAYSQVGFYILLGFSALMVAPALYILWTKTLPFHPIFIGIMAGVGAVAPDVAITVGGFAASDSERRSATKPATVSDAASDAQRPNQRRSATVKPRSATKPATTSDAQASLYRCVCGFTEENRYKYSGHTGKCDQFKAHKAAQGAIPVDLSAKTPANAERGER
jgi:hypothetical protein